MRELLGTNWFVLLVAVVILCFVIYLFITKQWTKLKESAYALMLQAERVYASYEGKKKFEAVFDCLYYKLIPLCLKPFITPESVRKKLQKWYNDAKQDLLKQM
jgi:hypothetical protein